MSQEKKYLRKVEPKDIGLLYKWTNDKDVRQNSFNTEPITYEEHKKWFEKQMSKDMGMFYILMVDDMPVGQIRLSVKGDLAEVNYSIDTSWRGMGYGEEIVRLTVEKVRTHYPDIKTLIARVKPENVASAKCFEKNDFIETYQQFELRLE